MVKVITIRDDVYEKLKQLKTANNMSFSEIIEYLIKESKTKPNLLAHFVGTISEGDVERSNVWTKQRRRR